MRERDNQKSKVYGTERIIERFYDLAANTNNVVTVNGVTVTLPPEAKFGNVESIQTYVERVLAMPAIREAYPALSLSVPKVRHRKGAKKAHYCAGEIAIPTNRDGRWAMRELVVLHELAHHLAPFDQHGPRFVSTLLHLMGTVLGPEAELVARMTFDDNGVNTTRPKNYEKFFAAPTGKEQP